MEQYLSNYNKFKASLIYDFKVGYGGIGDYIKFFMMMLTYCMKNNIRAYRKVNNIEIEKYIKIKYDELNITIPEILKLENARICIPHMFYKRIDYDFSVNTNEIFYFDDIVKDNALKIMPSLPSSYVSLHLRLGDKFLETDKAFVPCKEDTRTFTEVNIERFITDNSGTHIFLCCDNNNKKQELKKKYKQLMIADSEIGHTSLSNTTSQQILDSVTEFYILTNSTKIGAASYSGFSFVSSKFNNIGYEKLY